MRRLRRLSNEGWLLAETGHTVKARLQPAWAPGVPWSFAAAHQGKPNAVRTYRVPLALFDSYLGRLEPRAGRTPALITRYFDRPLLDLRDLGSYALVIAGLASPTPRLAQLGLVEGAMPLAPQPLNELLARAAAGELHLSDDGTTQTVAPSMRGWQRLGHDKPSPFLGDRNESLSGSPSGSNSATQRITLPWQHELPFRALECDIDTGDSAMGTHAWDSRNERNESTNPPPQDSCGMGGGDVASDAVVVHALPAAAHDLDPALRDGHAVLNAARAVRPGEWLELLQLQRDHGTERLLIWQARAARAERDPARGIVPAYYAACDANEACAGIGQDIAPTEPCVSAPAEPPAVQSAAPQSAPVTAAPPGAVPLDPACDALLRTMGVRKRTRLAGVPYELIAAWHAAIQHPGMAARFADPVAFAVSQLNEHAVPPTSAELERWVNWQHRSSRNAPPQLIAPNEPMLAADEVALTAQVRTLLPDATADDLALLASLLGQGATDDEALTLLQAQRAYEAQQTLGEVIA
jgi:hypothetical protein